MKNRSNLSELVCSLNIRLNLEQRPSKRDGSCVSNLLPSSSLVC